MTPAETIWNQISVKTKMLVSAREACSQDRHTLMFKVWKRCERIRVRYVPRDDSYTVELWFVRGTKMRMLRSAEGVYVENLDETIIRFSEGKE